MADKITQGITLAIGFEWYDIDKGKQKIGYMKIPNPRTGLTEQQIKTAAATLLTGEDPILQDDYGHLPSENPLTCVTAYTESTRTIDYDIGIE